MPDSATTLQLLGAALNPRTPTPQGSPPIGTGAPIYVTGTNGQDVDISRDPQALAAWQARQGSSISSSTAPSTAPLTTADRLAMMDAALQGKLPPAPQQQAPTRNDVGLIPSIGTGFNEGLANTAGAAVDLTNWGLRRLGFPVSDEPVGGSQWIKQDVLGPFGLNPDDIPVNGEGERIARGIGGGVAGMVLPYGAARTLAGEAVPLLEGATGVRAAGPVTAQGARTIPQTVASTIGEGSLRGNAAIGAAAGGAGQAAADVTPEPYRSLADFAAQLAAGGVTGGASALLRGTGRTALDVAGHYVAPLDLPYIGRLNGPRVTVGTDDAGNPLTVRSSQAQLAGQRITGAATDPAAVRAQLTEPQPNLVPGSAPTTAQLTGDPGLARLQAQLPQAAFDARAAQQNTARIGALDNLAPGGDPQAVGNFLRDSLARINAIGDREVAQAASRASGANAALPQGISGEEAGNAIRGDLAAGRSQARAAESQLWQAIDPNGTLRLDVTPAQQAAAQIRSGVSDYARPPEGEESAILGKLQMAPRVMPFSDFTALRSRLLDAVRTERATSGQTPALLRMNALRQVMDDTIATGAQRVAAQDAQAVAAGQMAPANSIFGRVANLWRGQGLGPSFLQQVADAYAARGVNPAIGRVSGGFSGAPAFDTGAARTTGGPSAVGGSRPPQRGPGGSPPSPVSYGAEAAPSFDAGAAQRYRVAADATRNRVATFDTGITGKVLRPGPTAGSYRLPDSAVAAKFFNGTEHAGEDVRAFLAAAGNRPTAVTALQDYATGNLRNFAERDGVLDPARTETWIAKHQDALRPFPELVSRFRDAATASRTLRDTAEARALALKQQQHYSATQFIGADPVQAVSSALRGKDAANTFAKLTRWTAMDKTGAATEGLRRAVVEYLQTKSGVSANGIMRADAFEKLLAGNRGPLSMVFPGKRMEVLENIAADLRRADTSLPTPRSATPEPHEGHGGNLLTYLVGLAVEHVTGNLGHAVLAGGAIKAFSMLRNRGLRTVDDLVTQAMLHPEVARTLMGQANSNGNRVLLMKRLASQLETLTGAAGVESEQKQRRTGTNG